MGQNDVSIYTVLLIYSVFFTFTLTFFYKYFNEILRVLIAKANQTAEMV